MQILGGVASFIIDGNDDFIAEFTFKICLFSRIVLLLVIASTHNIQQTCSSHNFGTEIDGEAKCAWDIWAGSGFMHAKFAGEGFEDSNA
jgi:hypothetical protein